MLMWAMNNLLILICLVIFNFSLKSVAQATKQASSSSETSIVTFDESKPVLETMMYEKQVENKYSLFAHKRTFILPISYTDKPSRDIYTPVTALQNNISEPYYQNLESEFQISFFIPVVRKFARSDWDLNFAYTHHSWWQVYNAAWSKPFRETNYAPELFFRYLQKSELKIFGLKLLGYDLGYMHQSNGQTQLLSRSWDRLYARASLTSDDYMLTLTAWARMPEVGPDDNPEILKYMGLGEVIFQKNISDHSVEAKVAFSEFSNFELNYSYPWKDGFRWFVSVRTGTGHSLIEFDKGSNRIAMGISLDNFFDYRKPPTKSVE